MAEIRISNAELEKLGNILIKRIQTEFAVKHLSKNLVNTLKIYVMDGKVEVVIPAQTYNMLKYQKDKVIIHTSHGSYASKLDVTGSEFFIYPGEGRKGSWLRKPHNHIGYVDKVIKEAINEWLSNLKDWKMESITEL